MRRIRFAAMSFVALVAAALAYAVLPVVGATVARAHTDEHFDKMQTPNGGQVRMAGPYHLELVVGRGEVTLHVNDHADNPIATAEGSAKVIIRWSKRNRYVVILNPVGGNVMHGTGEFKLGKANDVSVLLALPGQDPQRAQFRVDRNGKPIAAARRKAK